ncbi:MAG: dihydroxy-acid dehydratase [Cytophagia bacterium]|nr:dihydroxy-acid dehydratase [Cytophagia bacterium]
MSVLNKYSRTITQDPSLPASQAMLYGIGLTEHDLTKAQVGIVSTGFDGNTCNMHLNALAQEVKTAVWDNDLVGLIFHTIGVSDGIANGTEGMRYSLVSREVIADSIETVCGAQYYDALIAVVGCDKNMPGSVMAMGRLNRPAIMVYGGTIAGGHWKGKELNIVSSFEALGEKIANKLSDEDFKGIIQNSCPGAGACGGMYTANTMASAIEALGMALPYSSSNPALSKEKSAECAAAGEYILHLLEHDIKMGDLHKIGGTPLVMKYLLDKGFLHGDCLTVTGKTIAENLKNVPTLDFNKQDIIHPIERPLKATGHLQILYGNLAAKGSVAKITGKEGERFKGTARVFNGEFELTDGIRSGKIKAGDVVVIRYVGPRGAPGMPEMLKPTSLIMGSGLGKSVALITDGRFSGGSHGFVIGHITPEAFDGGLIALVEDGDTIEIDVQKHEINLLVEDSVLDKRRKNWKQPALRATKGILKKYAQQVKTAADGCVTDEN